MAFDHSTTMIIMSSGKAYEAFAMAKLVEQGLLDYNEKIVTYWPEFAAKHSSKASFTVADLLRHDTNLAWFNDSGVPLATVTAPGWQVGLGSGSRAPTIANPLLPSSVLCRPARAGALSEHAPQQ